jgi:uncharacterized protein YhdP
MDPTLMDDSTQNEITRLKREIARLQAQLKTQQASVPVRSSTASLINDYEFLADMARFAEGIYTEQAVRKKWRFDENTWSQLAEDERLVEKIEATKTARIRNGSSARERAQKVYVETPSVLSGILRDNDASPRHRIEAAREIRAVAATGPEAQPTTEMFHISINLGADEVLRISKPIAPGLDDDGNIIEQKALPMIEEDNGGQPV